ncbi:MAG: hypothetical protein Q4C46_08370 [Bacillota bacterium]|nr:hypothetical protein [Bacillota bacterium]
MIYGITGAAAYCMYILYDINSVLWRNRLLHLGFMAGTVMLAAVTAAMAVDSIDGIRMIESVSFGMNISTYIFILLELLFLGLLVYTLFFALPFKETYSDCEDNDEKPEVCRKGMYALCRHPGVLWLTGAYVCLAVEFSTAEVIINSSLFVALDVLYVIFQDKWTFVRTFADYEEYKRETPFLIPCAGSIRKCLQTMKG